MDKNRTFGQGLVNMDELSPWHWALWLAISQWVVSRLISSKITCNLPNLETDKISFLGSKVFLTMICYNLACLFRSETSPSFIAAIISLPCWCWPNLHKVRSIFHNVNSSGPLNLLITRFSDWRFFMLTLIELSSKVITKLNVHLTLADIISLGIMVHYGVHCGKPWRWLFPLYVRVMGSMNHNLCNHNSKPWHYL